MAAVTHFPHTSTVIRRAVRQIARRDGVTATGIHERATDAQAEEVIYLAAGMTKARELSWNGERIEI